MLFLTYITTIFLPKYWDTLTRDFPRLNLGMVIRHFPNQKIGEFSQFSAKKKIPKIDEKSNFTLAETCV